MRKYAQYFIALVIVLGSNQANATIITLDNNNIRVTGNHIESEFKITAPIGLVNGGNLAERSHLTELGFSGDYMETWNTDAVFNLETVSGNPFNFISLDIGSYYSATGKHLGLAAWTFTGFDGSLAIFSLINPESTGRLILNWTNLTRVTIQSSRASSASAFDNIDVLALPPAPNVSSEAKPIDAPQSTLLTMTALFLISLRRSKSL